MALNINFRPSVTHLRILFLTVNLVLALGLLGMGGYSIYRGPGSASETGPDSQTVTSVEIVNPAALLYREGEINPQGPRGATRLPPVADWLQPKRRVVAVEPGPEPGSGEEGTETTTAEVEAIDGGPLAEKWEYVFYIIGSNPLDTYVRLRMKDDAPATTVPTRTSTRRTPVRRPTSSRTTRSTSIRRKPVKAELSFFVGDRLIKNEEHEVEFMIDDASTEFLTYWESRSPGKLYRLPYTEETHYMSSGRKELASTEKKEEEGEEEKKIWFEKVELGVEPEDVREEQYDLLKSGEKTLSQLSTLSGEGRVNAIADEGEGSSTSTIVTPASRAPRFQGSSKTPMTREEGVREIGNVLREAREKGKLKKADEKQLKELEDMLKGKDGKKKAVPGQAPR